MKLPCAVTRDLLPLYAEDMVEPETRELIGQHLTDCPACRERLSALNTDTGVPVETAAPLRSLKRQIRKRRRHAAAIAALCVFVVLFTFFYHETDMRPVPWEEGLIEVKGTETRPRSEVNAEGAAGSQETTVEVLVLRTDRRIGGTRGTMFPDEDGTNTLILQGFATRSPGTAGEYEEMVFWPVPDRVIYEDGDQQTLLWGEPLGGGVEILPRLALGYYAIIAAVFAAVSGTLWFLLRNSPKGRVARQVFFAPLSWLEAHFLIKGFGTASFFMERDFIGILLLAVALYALLSLAWQAFLQQKKPDYV